jgi:hypothetical protein
MGPDDTGRVVGYSETPLLSILRASLCGGHNLKVDTMNKRSVVFKPINV